MAGFDVAVVANLEVVDLLLKIFKAAVTSTRHKNILVPFPAVPDPVKKTEMTISDPEDDYLKLVGIVKKIPCTRRLKETGAIEGKNYGVAESAQEDPLFFPLIRWVVTSNRAYLTKLLAPDQLAFLNTPHQYFMKLDSPAKEDAFKLAKQSCHESIFAFHGSPFENWHSILRRGLVVASGTALQLFGAAYGNGIYVSPHLGTAIAYASGYYYGTANVNTTTGCQHDCSESGRYLTSSGRYICVALCEVIPTEALKKPQPDIWVISNADLVCTRMLLVYEWEQVMSGEFLATRCNDPTTLAAIREAVNKYRQDI